MQYKNFLVPCISPCSILGVREWEHAEFHIRKIIGKSLGNNLSDFLACCGHFFMENDQIIGVKAPGNYSAQFGLIASRFAYGRDRNLTFS